MPHPAVDNARPLTALRSGPLKGRFKVPGDKSISHRALMFGAMATGHTEIQGLLEAGDVINTARAVTAMGAKAEKVGATWRVTGRGVGGLVQPDHPLDFGNSGTGTRLILGIVAGHPIEVTLTGDASLSRRPMGRVLKPLKQMGLIVKQDREQLPLTVHGSADLVPIVYELPVASAQLKSAILLAGLHAAGRTTVIGEPTRDHTERMLRHFGAEVVSRSKGRLEEITVTGDAELIGRSVQVPGDPSSAAFLVAAALIVPDSEIEIQGVLTNPTRTGFYETLIEMGADVTLLNARDQGGEPVADIRARFSPGLKGVRVPPDRAPSMIDEYPVLAAVAAFARGETRMEGLAELKVKESDRLAATAAGLAVNGVEAKVDGDTLIVTGAGSGGVAGGGRVTTHMDHRIAMAFAVLGLAAKQDVTVDDETYIATSFPEFRSLMEAAGARFSQSGNAGADHRH